MKKLLIPLILVILLSTLALAQPPFQSTNTAGTLEIRSPPYEFIPRNQAFTLNTHVFNVSNGFLMQNDSTSCLLHLYNKNGTHLLQKTMDWDSNNIDFKLDLGAGNFSVLGTYAYIIQCNTSYNGGFVSGTYKVTEDGEDDTSLDNTSGISITIFFIIIIIGIILLATRELSHSRFLNLVFKRCLIILAIYLMMMNSAMMMTIADMANLPLTQEIFRYSWLFGIVGWVAILFTTLVTLWEAVQEWKMTKKRRRMGEDE